MCWPDPKVEQLCRLFVVDRAEKQLQTQKLLAGKDKGQARGESPRARETRDEAIVPLLLPLRVHEIKHPAHA